MDIQEVVFPVDFSERAAEACPYVAAITQRVGAGLTLLHVVENFPPGSTAWDRLHTEDESVIEQRKQQAVSGLAAFQSHYLAQMSSKICVLAGDPAAAIVAYAGEGDGRLVVMPTHGYGPFRRFLLGSVTAKVLHDARCPVLTGPHLDKGIHPTEWFALRRIMCAVSLNWETDQVLKRAAALAARLGAELIAFHVVAPLEEGLWPVFDQGGPSPSIEAGRRTVQDAVYRTGGLARVCVSVGEVSHEVARAARAHNADLVIIGKGGGPEMPGRLGSHAYGIVRRVPCPVLCL
jgi:nucleotide-binding universal stress UspA family protein